MKKTVNTNTRISKFKLVNEGRGGMKVTYERPSKRGEFNFLDHYDAKFRAPVNYEVIRAINALDKYAIDILQLDAAPEDVRVVGVSSDAESKFVLIVQVNTYGKKAYTVPTPCYKESDANEYGDYHEVIKLIENLFNEVRMYISESKMMDTARLAEVFAAEQARKEEGFDPNSINNMSAEELKAFCRGHLESLGAIVMEDDDSEGVTATVPPATPKEGTVIQLLPMTATSTQTEVPAMDVVVVEEEPVAAVAGGLF
jgi:hypothetical protein